MAASPTSNRLFRGVFDVILRRLRGIVGTGLLWAISWGLLLGGLSTVAATILAPRLPFPRAFLEGALAGLGWGFATGVLFGSALMLAEQARGFAGLTLRRAALWGAIAGTWFPTTLALATRTNPISFLARGWVIYLITGTMGAVSALATVWLARRGAAGALESAAGPAGLGPGEESSRLEARPDGTGVGQPVRSATRRE